MKICICSATKMEMPISIWESDHDKLVHGVGSPSTAYNLGRYLSNIKPDLMIQIGLAGSYTQDLNLGLVVSVKQDIFADLGVDDSDGSFIHISEMPFADQDDLFNHKWLESPLIVLPEKIISVKAITVNTTSGLGSKIEKTRTMYQPQIESMEGAAFFAACIASQIPCMQIRAISNLVEPRNKNNWNIPLALTNLEKVVIKILQGYH